MRIRTRIISSILIASLFNGNLGPAFAASELPSSPYMPAFETVKPKAHKGHVSHTRFKKDYAVPVLEKYLLEGKLQEGEVALASELQQHSDDDQLRFGLGMLQFFRAVEKLMQDFYVYGVHDPFPNFDNSGHQFPLPFNPKPALLTYGGARRIAENLLENLSKSEATLSDIKDPNVQLPLHVGLIRLDLNRDGKVDADETLWKLYTMVQTSRHIKQGQAERFVINFDRGDVHWLRGYCHLLMAFIDIYLAYDTRDTFDRTAHLLFSNVDSPYKFLSQRVRIFNEDAECSDLLDLLAGVHSIRWAVVEPQRMEESLHHLEAVTDQSKESWKYIMAETDDDREWLPNPKQTGIIPGVKVKKEMITAWLNAMEEAHKLLAGDLLIPFWRGNDKQGVNLRKVFLEPSTLDIVLWIQGKSAEPYLEKGKMSESGVWSKLPAEFGEHFPGFAMWFN